MKLGLKRTVKRIGSFEHRWLVNRAWNFSLSEINAYQTRAFFDMYRHARKWVPYYRDDTYAYPAEIPSRFSDALQALPILSKDSVRENQERLLSNDLNLRSFNRTSGTTGTPLRLAASLWERSLHEACLQRWYEQLCGDRYPRTLFLTGAYVPKVTHRRCFEREILTNARYVSIYDLSPARRDAFRRLMGEFDPDLVYGYASALHQFCLLLDPDLAGGDPRRFVVSTSEILSPEWRCTISERLGAPVFDLYGSQEGCHMVMECPEGGRHVNPLVGIIEILDENGGPAVAGTMGRVVVTGLVRKSMPLIRYDIGDYAVAVSRDQGCTCGLQWPMIGPITGRSDDLARTRDGRRIGYLAFHATKNLSGIKELQLVQRNFELFECNVVLDEERKGEPRIIEDSIRAELRARFSQDVSVEFTYLPGIPRGPNGKFKAVVVDFSG